MASRKKKHASAIPSFLKKEQNQRRLWLGFFGIWILILLGVPHFMTGAPGLFQYFQMGRAIDQRKSQLKELESQRDRLERENLALSTNPYVQQREIRRVLGYARPGELIFDFSTGKE